MKDEKILITGCAGFIGMSLSESLLKDGFQIIGVDSVNDYYSIDLKYKRLERLKRFNNFLFEKYDISNLELLKKTFKKFKPTKVINLAAQAGVRYSLINPHEYINSNVVGFMNILECCRHYKTSRLIYASSSSVYGGSKKEVFSINDKIDQPISIYAATKASNELMAKTYSHLYDLNTIGLRFFTVYGPWGRPDMAMYIFTKKMINGESLPVFNRGDMHRDFTYIEDIIDGIRKALDVEVKCDIFNLGNNKSNSILDLISYIEDYLKLKAKIDFQDIQPGDVKKTVADIEYSKKVLNYNPKTKLKDGVFKFIDWYKKYMMSKL